MPPSPHRLAIFDLDGTVFKTESLYLEAFRRATEDLNLEKKPDNQIIAHFAYTTPEMCRKLYPETDTATQSALSERVRLYERTLISTHGQLYSGIQKLLISLHASGWNCALCTNGSPVYVDNILDGLSIRHFFDRVCLRDDLHTKTDHIKKLSDEFGIHCIMIGDKAGDIEAAAANNVPSIGVTWGYGTEQELQNATFIVSTAEDLTSLLNRPDLFSPDS